MNAKQTQMQAESQAAMKMPDTSSSPHELIASDRVEGTNVYRSDGTKIGHIERIMIDKRSGQAAYAVMNFGGFLGMGGDSYPLPWSVLTYNTSLGGYEVNVSNEQLKNAPRRIFAQLDSAAESLRRRIEQDKFYFAGLAHRVDSRHQLHQHALVQQIVLGTVECQVRDFAFDFKLHELEVSRLRGGQRQRPQHLGFARRFVDLHAYGSDSPCVTSLTLSRARIHAHPTPCAQSGKTCPSEQVRLRSS